MSDANAKPQHPVLTVKYMTPPHQWSSGWQSFRQAHPGWRLASTPEPVYALPEPAINRLALPRGATPALLDDDDVAAEHEFAQLCRLHHAIGCWGDRPIWYDLLQAPGPLVEESLLKLAGWSPQEQLEAQQLAAGSPERRWRLIGCAGWLLTEPAYLQETQELSEQWRAMPADQRPPFPLGRVWQLPNENASRQPPPR